MHVAAVGVVAVRGGVDEDEEADGELERGECEDDGRRWMWTDEGAGEVDACRADVGAVEPGGFGEAEEPLAVEGHGGG